MHWSYAEFLFTNIQKRGSEFSSHEIESQNRATQIDVTLRVITSLLKNKKFHFELLTQRLNLCFLPSSYQPEVKK